MRIAYCSLLLPEEKKLAERSKERLSGISLHKFTRAIINGLDSNLCEPVTVFNIINTLNYPKFPDLFFRTEKWSHIKDAKDWHIGYINLFGIKYITQTSNLYNKLKNWVLEKDEKCIICVHHIYYPSMLAAIKIKLRFGDKVKLCLITGDMNGMYGLASQYKPNLKQKLLRYVENKIDSMAKEFDCFVFATKMMAEGFGVEHKPFTVVECSYVSPPYLNENTDVKEDLQHKTLFYAGAIRKEYGIIHLLNAFSIIKGDEYRLFLAGDGNAVPYLKEAMKKDKRIQYLGFLSPQKVDEMQKRSTALISPRIAANYEYVKYSFPSKTMECLASGKPYIAHKLPCDPEEYETVIQYADNESDEALAKKIVEICSLKIEERKEIGERAIKFIENEKNPNIMTKRIVSMWNGLFENKKCL